MTRTPDKYIAAAVAYLSPTQMVWVSDIYAVAEKLQAAEENPPRVKCSRCPGMMAKPTPCMNPDCGFRK